LPEKSIPSQRSKVTDGMMPQRFANRLRCEVAMARVPVPRRMRETLLLKNSGACCVCKARHVGLNFHHIDGDASNTVEGNIAVLCVRDHDAHHRPEVYRPKAAMNHVDLGREVIVAKKAEWEAFVAEARRPQPGVLATFTAYGTEESIHAAKLAFQWANERADGRTVFERIYHLLDAPPPRWADWAVEELVWLGRGIKLVLLDKPVPVEHCPCCSVGMTRTIAAGLARRFSMRPEIGLPHTMQVRVGGSCAGRS
jgi:5-methylcytosine-specific restriction endonuclease McrA